MKLKEKGLSATSTSYCFLLTLGTFITECGNGGFFGTAGGGVKKRLLWVRSLTGGHSSLETKMEISLAPHYRTNRRKEVVIQPKYLKKFKKGGN